MGRWIKYFIDGAKEEGTDEDILLGKASWSRGELKDINSVHIYDSLFSSILSVPCSEWNQFDRYLAKIDSDGSQTIQRTSRVIQSKLKLEHVGSYINIFSIMTTTNVFVDKKPDKSLQSIMITEDYVDKWLTISLEKICRISFAKVLLAPRNQINGILIYPS